MRPVLGALLFMLCASCAVAQVGGGVDEPAVDGDGGSAPGVESVASPENVGEAEEAERQRLTDCEKGCAEFVGCGCSKMFDSCKGKDSDAYAYCGQWQTSCEWAVQLACDGSGLPLHRCFRACA